MSAAFYGVEMDDGGDALIRELGVQRDARHEGNEAAAERSWPPPTRYDGTAATRPGGAHLYWTGITWVEQDQYQISVGEYWLPLPPAPPSEVTS